MILLLIMYLSDTLVSRTTTNIVPLIRSLYFSSQAIGARRPLARDPEIDYEIDSDEEWEEVCFS